MYYGNIDTSNSTFQITCSFRNTHKVVLTLRVSIMKSYTLILVLVPY